MKISAETLARAQDKLAARAAMYADAAYSTYENNVTARQFDDGVRSGRRVCAEDDASCEECVDAAGEWQSLDDIPEIGSLQCMNNCRCFIEYAEPITGFGLESFSEEMQAQFLEGLVT